MEKLILRRVDRGPDEEMILNFGPQHPSTHGVINFIVETDGEVMKQGDPGRRLPAPLDREDRRERSATPASCRTPTASTTSRRCSRTRATRSRSRSS